MDLLNFLNWITAGNFLLLNWFTLRFLLICFALLVDLFLLLFIVSYFSWGLKIFLWKTGIVSCRYLYMRRLIFVANLVSLVFLYRNVILLWLLLLLLLDIVGRIVWGRFNYLIYRIYLVLCTPIRLRWWSIIYIGRVTIRIYSNIWLVYKIVRLIYSIILFVESIVCIDILLIIQLLFLLKNIL